MSSNAVELLIVGSAMEIGEDGVVRKVLSTGCRRCWFGSEWVRAELGCRSKEMPCSSPITVIAAYITVDESLDFWGYQIY
ncbi:hypothetical protein ACLOJK_002628 [Asimina triloba]